MTYQEFQNYIQNASCEQLAELMDRTFEIITDNQRFYITHCIKARKNSEVENLELLLQHVETFNERSRKGYFYYEFDMGGKNFSWVPPHTEAWFFELSAWLDRACKLVEEKHPETALKVFRICFDLIENMCEFAFAHELGDWMIHTEYDYETVYQNLTKTPNA